MQHQLSHRTKATRDKPQGTGRRGKPAAGRDQPTLWLPPSSPNTSASAQTHTLPEHSFGGSSPALLAQQPPNSPQQPATVCIGTQTGEDLLKKLVPALAQDLPMGLLPSPSWLRAAQPCWERWSRRSCACWPPPPRSPRGSSEQSRKISPTPNAGRREGCEQGLCCTPRGEEQSPGSAPSLPVTSSWDCPPGPRSIPMTLSKGYPLCS